ncbi:DNA-binding NarL/FixJ family response regulator [Paenibacillus phyllosphaerae]|uniref:DNA-binding NarL/FixJ family response regulator n=1 Tax=Paenibacillus phyllosphaerae TaxID=274593 RepID=A0A7W5FL88_9BACL|nr:response regulator transcription factor [Paenibacillus phyllosphaerae]MBB3108823.1 DNA-binding NarL/FixJ family response regulator [Paenibacillus phyllosphaerae]
MRIVIAEDHPMFRAGVRSLLATVEEMDVIGEAANGEEAIAQAEALQPDLILMDIRMPGMNGIEATQLIKERWPGIHILMLTMYRDDESVFTAMRVGAKGYVLKDADEEELLQAIRMVGTGCAVFSTAIAERMMDYFARPDTFHAGGSGDALGSDPLFAELTRRESDILMGIAGGDTNGQIAQRLGISAKTVANHVSNILNKLQVQGRHEARKLVEQSRMSPRKP